MSTQKRMHPDNLMNAEGIHTGLCKRGCRACMEDIVASARISSQLDLKKEHAIQALGIRIHATRICTARSEVH
jgi:hypothetical protein